MYVLEQALARLGYIVVAMDGRIIRDHVVGFKQLAKERSYIKVSREGVTPSRPPGSHSVASGFGCKQANRHTDFTV